MKVNIGISLCAMIVAIFFEVRLAGNAFILHNLTSLDVTIQAGSNLLGAGSSWVHVKPFSTGSVRPKMGGYLNKVDIRTVINGNKGGDGNGICIYYEKFAASPNDHEYTLIYVFNDGSLTANASAGTHDSPKISFSTCGANGRYMIFSGSGDPLDGTVHPSTFNRDYIKQ